MTLADEYKRQWSWRPWPAIFDALPPLRGQTVLDLGCGVGDQSAELAARGAKVIGIDANEDLLRDARGRGIAGAEFYALDLREPIPARAPIDGVWCSFAAAYFPDLTTVLAAWSAPLRPGGWIAVTEIEDLFGHEPVRAQTRSLLSAYAADALAAGRYDFHMGRRLRTFLERGGLAVEKTLILTDRELAFDGPACPEVVEAWSARLDRMKLLRDFCGAAFPQLRDDFLACLACTGHRCAAKVYCCVARKP